MAQVLYVYAVAREPVTPDAEAIDGSRRFGAVTAADLCAIFTPVDAEAFSQEAIDQRAGDLEWLGAIGYRHQDVMADLMRRTAIVPLRAFTLFSGESAVAEFLAERREALLHTLERLEGKQEWTLRIELEPQKWSDALTSRVASLRKLQEELTGATPGRAFLLRKKLDDEKKKASHTAEDELVREVEAAIVRRVGWQTLAETRQHREGAFPQINVLIPRDEEATLEEVRGELARKYEEEGVTLAVSGPWPPYTFAGAASDERA